MNPPPPRSSLFPYTTLFRSHRLVPREGVEGDQVRILVDMDEVGEASIGGALEVSHRWLHRLHPYRPGSGPDQDRKSTRLNSSHQIISYPVFCFKQKTTTEQI